MLVYELILVSQLVTAQYTVPTECIALAQKEGFKAQLDEEGARKANRRLKWLRVRHPFNSEIRECGRAVDRLKG